MRLLILTLLLVVAFINEGTSAQLHRISTTQTGPSIQIYTYFDILPVYSQRLTDRRLDLTFFKTITEEHLQLPNPDDILVKTLVVRDQDTVILSFFFRYIPQDVVISTDQSDTLIIDLVPGNRFTKTYRKLRSSLGQVSLVPGNRKTIANPLTFSPFRDNWLSFIENFGSTPFLFPAPRSYLPPFPLTSLAITGDQAQFDESLAFINGLDRKDWFESLRLIQKRLKSYTKEEERKYYAIAHADILLRLGRVETASSQFKILSKTYKNDIAEELAIYAVSVIEAQHLEFYKAQAKLQRLRDRLPGLHPLMPHISLALAETALATNQYKQMKQHLDAIGEMPPSLNPRVRLRSADLAFATGRHPEAFNIYHRFYGSSAMKEQPFSANGYCSILFSRQLYDESSICYQDLATILRDTEQIAQAHYLSALSVKLSKSESENLADRFSKIIENYPGTVGALRAELKQADACLLQRGDCTESIQGWYRNIADLTRDRDIAQEASFKEALVYHLNGDNLTSIQLLSRMFREFQTGKMIDYGQALLVQILPGEIIRLLTEGHEIEAIALAQQNRLLFENGWLDSSLLFRIGLAFENLAMYPEALQLFLYLKQRPSAENDESIHLASARAAHALGNFYLVEDLATDYFHRYPEGKYQLDILFYRLDCRYAVGHINEALNILPDPLPQRDDFRFIAASLYFHKNDYARTVDLLLPIYRTKARDLSDDHLYMLAESLFNLEYFSDCSTLYDRLATTDGYRQPARYRLAQLDEFLGKNADIDLLEKGSENGGDLNPWHRFAIQDSRYQGLLSTM